MFGLKFIMLLDNWYFSKLLFFSFLLLVGYLVCICCGWLMGSGIISLKLLKCSYRWYECKIGKVLNLNLLCLKYVGVGICGFFVLDCVICCI